ncbi:winged helix-turn-helix transcriptional regulator [Candidatus Saccharibacteria bacterium]|nr:winged helix-turn-helix transcriptional regulator [Candidatus Saccharibacteria bacterium]
MKVDNLANQIDQIAFLLARHADQTLQERLGFGFSQFKIFEILQFSPNLQQKQIAGKLSQTEASVSRQIKLSQSQMLLNVYINPKNKREHLISLTPKGERMSREAENILDTFHRSIFSKLSAKQQESLSRDLAEIYFTLKGSV